MNPSGSERQDESQQASSLRVAAVQMVSTPRIDENLRAAEQRIGEAVAQGAELIALPEYFPIMGMSDGDKVRVREHDGRGPIQDFLAASARWYSSARCRSFAPTVTVCCASRRTVSNPSKRDTAMNSPPTHR